MTTTTTTCAGCGAQITYERKPRRYCTTACYRRAVRAAERQQPAAKVEADMLGRWVIRRRWVSATQYVLEVVDYATAQAQPEDPPCQT